MTKEEAIDYIHALQEQFSYQIFKVSPNQVIGLLADIAQKVASIETQKEHKQ